MLVAPLVNGLLSVSFRRRLRGIVGPVGGGAGECVNFRHALPFTLRAGEERLFGRAAPGGRKDRNE